MIYAQNFSAEEFREWGDYLCDPQPITPVRIYAGGVTPVCYSFPDRETYELVNPEPSEPV